MKHKSKNYLKIGILLFGVLVFFSNCTEEHFKEKEENNSLSIKRYSLKQLTKLKPIVKNVKKLKIKGVKEKSFNDFLNFDNLNTQDITQITDENGYSTYSFKFETSSNSNMNFENLHLLETDNGGYIAYVLSYEPEINWYNNCINEDGLLNLDMANYQGDITKYSLDREIIWSTSTHQKSNNTFTVCTFSLVITCTEAWDGSGTGDPHTATSYCTNHNYLHYSEVETCETVYGAGGSSDESGGGTSESQDDCDDTSGTLIINDQPLNGIGTGCVSNNIINIKKEAVTSKNCEELHNITNSAYTALAFNTLNSTTTFNAPTEKGFFILRQSGFPFINVVPAPNPTASGLPLPANPNIYCILHSHPNHRIGMFSLGDVHSLYQIYERFPQGANFDKSRFTLFMMVQGYTYAIKIDDPSKLVNIDTIYQNSIDKKRKNTKLELDYDRALKNFGSLEKVFLKTMENLDLGISVFKSNNNDINYDPNEPLDNQTSNWEKLTLEDNNTITKTKC